MTTLVRLRPSARIAPPSIEQRLSLLTRRFDAMNFLAGKPDSLLKVYGSHAAFREEWRKLHNELVRAQDMAAGA